MPQAERYRDVAPIDDEVRLVTADSIPAEANSAMLDPDDPRRLWALSERLLDRGSPVGRSSVEVGSRLPSREATGL